MWQRALLLLALLLAACAAAFVPPPVSPQLVDAARARWPGTTREELQRGHDTFVASCGKGGFCHRLKDPRNYSEEKLPRILEKMSRKAHLQDAQKTDVLRFLLAARASSPAPPPPASAAAPPVTGASR